MILGVNVRVNGEKNRVVVDEFNKPILVFTLDEARKFQKWLKWTIDELEKEIKG